MKKLLLIVYHFLLTPIDLLMCDGGDLVMSDGAGGAGCDGHYQYLWLFCVQA